MVNKGALIKTIPNGKEFNLKETLCFVKAPNGEIVCDFAFKLKEEKAVYVESTKSALLDVIKHKLLQTELKGDIKEDFFHQVKSGVEKKLLYSLALAKKSGELIIGTSAVMDAVNAYISCKGLNIIIVSNAGDDLKKKSSLWQKKGATIENILTKEKLENMLGIANAAVVAWRGKNTKFVTNALKRYKGFV